MLLCVYAPVRQGSAGECVCRVYREDARRGVAEARSACAVRSGIGVRSGVMRGARYAHVIVVPGRIVCRVRGASVLSKYMLLQAAVERAPLCQCARVRRRSERAMPYCGGERHTDR